MPSEWKVTFQYIGGKEIYQVYRLKDINEVDHSGNRRYASGVFNSQEDAQTFAESLNFLEGR